MWNCRNKNIKINALPVQQQTNGVDCDLFALAFCSEVLLRNSNPVGIYFQEDKLRSHLLHCLAADKKAEFPKSTKENKICGEKLFHIDIFCSCRMPWKKNEKNIYEKQMAKCCSYKEWFHRMCERIPDKVFSQKNLKIEWVCLKCKGEKD